MTPPDQRDIPHHMTSSSAIKLGGWTVAGPAVAHGLAWHPSVGGEQLFSFASLVFLGFGEVLFLLSFSSFYNY